MCKDIEDWLPESEPPEDPDVLLEDFEQFEEDDKSSHTE